MNNLNKRLLLLFVLIIAVWVFFNPLLSLNLIPGSFGARDYRQRQYIVDNGRLYEPTGIGTRDGQIGDGYNAVGILPNIFFAQLNIVTNTIEYKDGMRLLQTIQIGHLILMPLFGVLFLKYFLKKQKYSSYEFYKKGIVLVLISIFPLASAIPEGPIQGASANIVARALLLLIIFFIFRINDNRMFVLLLLFVTAIYYHFWHTWSYYLAAFLLVLLISSFLFIKNKRLIYFSIYGLIMYFVTGLYFYNILIELPFRGFINFLSFNSQIAREITPPELLVYRTTGNIYSIFQIINTILIFSIIIFAVVYIFKKFLSEKKFEYHDKIIISFGITIFVIWLFLFIKGGFGLLVGRGLELTIPFFIISVAFLLSKQNFDIFFMKKKVSFNLKQLIVILIVIVLLAAWSHNNSPSSYISEVNEYEEYGGKFIGENTRDNASFFSDFRIVTSLIRYNKSYLYSPDLRHLDDPAQFLSIFYNQTNPSHQLDAYISADNYYVITSEKQIEWGILSSQEDQLKPGRDDFRDNFRNDSNFLLVYSNSYCEVFYRS